MKKPIKGTPELIDGQTPTQPDNVNHPPHYGGADSVYETIKVLAAWMTPGELAGFLKGNAIKYLSRAGKKDPTAEAEDYRKAIWYIQRLFDLVSSKKGAL